MSQRVVMTESESWSDEDILYLEMRGKLPADFRQSLGSKGRKALEEGVVAGEVPDGGIRPSGKKARGKNKSDIEEAEDEPTDESTNDELRTWIVETSEELGVEADVSGNKKALRKTVAKLQALRNAGTDDQEEEADEDGS